MEEQQQFLSLQRKVDSLGQKLDTVLGKIGELASSYKDLAQCTARINADRAAKDERWRNHEAIHERDNEQLEKKIESMKVDIKELERGMHGNALSIAKVIGMSSLGGGIVALVQFLIEKFS